MANKAKKIKKSAKVTTKTKAKVKVKVKAKTKVKSAVKTKSKTAGKVKANHAKKKVQSAKKAPAKKASTAKKAKTIKKEIPLKAKALTSAPLKKPVKLIDYSKAVTPLADRLVIRVTEQPKMTAGGLHIPDSVAMLAGHVEGEVLAVGHGAKNKKGMLRPLDVKIGDYVLFSEYAGTKIEFNSEELQIIKESDVMGIVEK